MLKVYLVSLAVVKDSFIIRRLKQFKKIIKSQLILLLIKEILNSVQQVGILHLTIFLNQILICRKEALKYVAQVGVNLRLLPKN